MMLNLTILRCRNYANTYQLSSILHIIEKSDFTQLQIITMRDSHTDVNT